MLSVLLTISPRMSMDMSPTLSGKWWELNGNWNRKKKWVLVTSFSGTKLTTYLTRCSWREVDAYFRV
jgi:hypothetical protein